MNLPTPDAVETLVSAALAGMASANPRASSDEILSASFTLTQRVIAAVLKKPNASPSLIRQSIELMLLETIGSKETKQ